MSTCINSVSFLHIVCPIMGIEICHIYKSTLQKRQIYVDFFQRHFVASLSFRFLGQMTHVTTVDRPPPVVYTLPILQGASVTSRPATQLAPSGDNFLQRRLSQLTLCGVGFTVHNPGWRFSPIYFFWGGFRVSGFPVEDEEDKIYI